MQRLTSIFPTKGPAIFDVEDIVSLLAHKREEAFEGERAVRLVQFASGFFFQVRQRMKAAKWAALITAVKFLDRAEEDYFC